MVRAPKQKEYSRKRRSQKVDETKVESLTLKDTIDALAIYDLEHCRFPHNYLAEVRFDIDALAGLVIDGKRLILIDKEQCFEMMKEAIIHELIHCKHFLRGDLPRNNRKLEKIVDAETKKTYKELYGAR